MSIKRNPVSEPRWVKNEYATVCNLDLFSSERWGKTVKWNLLQEQAKKINNIVNVIDDAIYGTKLFNIYIDLLEANLYIYDDLFYFLVGERITCEPFEKFVHIVRSIQHRLRFWNMDCQKDIDCIFNLFSGAYDCFYETLSQPRLWELRDELSKEEYCFQPPSPLTSKFNITSSYIYGAYKVENRGVEGLVKHVVLILNYLSNFHELFSQIRLPLLTEDFSDLLEQFRQSERGKDYVNAWEQDLGGTRDSLISKMEKDRNLSPWVNKYIHLRKNEDVLTQLFYDEKTGEIINEEEAYNTDNCINLLTVAAILREYDERRNSPNIKLNEKTGFGIIDEVEASLHPEMQRIIYESYIKMHPEKKAQQYVPASNLPKKTRRIKLFREFIKDSSQTDIILEKLHRLIGNKTNTDALKIITRAMWIEWIERPTATSIKNEFPTIVCSSQMISKCLNEEKPTHPSNAIEKIRLDYERA